MKNNKKTLFIIKASNIIDVITNSSSELFVFKGENENFIKEMIKEIVPDYLREYEELKHINDLSIEELDNYISYHCSPHVWPASKNDYPILQGFSFDELYEPEIDYLTGEKKNPDWNGEIQYQLRNNKKFSKFKYDFSFVTEENRQSILDRIDPNRSMFFLYSKDENPTWEDQEKLMNIGERYHLG